MLESNADFGLKTEIKKPSPKREDGDGAKIYVKIDSLEDRRISVLTRISLLNPGSAKIIVYDMKSRKYSALKDASVAPTEKVISRIKSVFGDENVVFK